jgi:hypothetical protein
MMTTALGGPGTGCSAMRLRRLAAGELSADERARTELHLDACPRCQAVAREQAEERARLAADLPFETFAAGVAGRLATRPRRRPWAAVAAVALAAALLAAISVPVLRRTGTEETSRVKGGAALDLWASAGGAEARALAPGEPVPAGASLRVGLTAPGRAFAAVALVDADGAVVLDAGPARAGVLPGAFEWVGQGEGTLVAVLDDAPIDAAALADRLARAGPAAAAPGARAEVLVRPLRRSRP